MHRHSAEGRERPEAGHRVPGTGYLGEGILAGGLLLLGLALSGAAARAELPALNVSNGDWPPYFLEKGGFARDLLDTCLPEAGYTVRYRPVSIEQSYEGLRNGIVDLHIFSRRADRESFLSYGSEVFFSDNYQPVALAGKGARIKSKADLDGLRLGHLEGLRYTDDFLEYIRTRREAGTLVVAQSNEELLDLLLSDKIDVFVNLTSTAGYLAKSRGVSSRVEIAPYVIKGSEYYLTVAKASRRVTNAADLLAKVDACVKGMKTDGRYRELEKKYGLE